MKIIYTITFAVAILGFAGLVQDIYKFVNCDFKAPYKAEILYGVGLIPPIGSIMGWLNIQDNNGEK